MATTILPTRNTDWGFWGSIAHSHYDLATDAAAAWEIASRRIAETTEASPEGVRDFLDSRYGRHFGDDVANEIWTGASLDAAINAAITRWMLWTITRSDHLETGIAQGLPYLTGFANHYAILAELPY